MGARIADLFALRADGSEFSAGIRLAPFRIGDKLFVAAAIRDMTERRLINDELVAGAQGSGPRQSRQEPVPGDRESRSAPADAGDSPAECGDDEDRAGRRGSRAAAAAGSGHRKHDAPAQRAAGHQPSGVGRHRACQRGSAHRRDFRGAALGIFVRSPARETSICESSRRDIAISTDRTLFYQLLQNLLGNALKYTDRGWVRVKCAEEGDAVVIWSRIPGSASRPTSSSASSTSTTRSTRTAPSAWASGLGLAIVKEVARLLGFTCDDQFHRG